MVEQVKQWDTTLFIAVERAYKNKSKSCLLCYNFKLIKDKLRCPYNERKRWIVINDLHTLISYARMKAKNCENYDGEF
jgi:hypothetical protein